MEANHISNPQADLQRAKYHLIEFEKKNTDNMNYYVAVAKGAVLTAKRSLSPKKK